MQVDLYHLGIALGTKKIALSFSIGMPQKNLSFPLFESFTTGHLNLLISPLATGSFLQIFGINWNALV